MALVDRLNCALILVDASSSRLLALVSRGAVSSSHQPTDISARQLTTPMLVVKNRLLS